MWTTLDFIRGKGGATGDVSTISADQLHIFFDDKVAAVRQNTSSASPATFSTVAADCRLSCFASLSVDDVITATLALPNKQCVSDPIPTQLLKAHIHTVAPFITELFNRSFLAGIVPRSFKSAYVTPLLKKADLDVADVKSYRPISNLTVLSKLLEHLVADQLRKYITQFQLLPAVQSAYRVNHSTETAILKVSSDLLQAVDDGDICLLILLDLSAAFDTVDHQIMIKRLLKSCGLSGSVLNWFTSYLDGRTQRVVFNGASSAPSAVSCGVPQGSVLGPVLFTLYTADLVPLIQRHKVNPHLYADDAQIYGRCRPADAATLQCRASACLQDVADWMSSNRLQLNSSKTEVMWVASDRKQHLLPNNPFSVSDALIKPVLCVRDLGIYLDSDTSMRSHIVKTVAGCFGAMRTLRSISHSVPKPVLRTLVSALVLSRLDYGNAMLFGLPDVQLLKYQAVLNSAARLIFGAGGRCHVTPLLQQLHWLSARERITFKIACFVWRCINGLGPAYLSNSLQLVSHSGRRTGLRSEKTMNLVTPRMRNVTHGDRAWPAAAAAVWNYLEPRSLQTETDYLAFRRGVKTMLFKLRSLQ